MIKAKTKYARVTQVGANINTVNKYSIKSIPLYENLYTLEFIKNTIEKYRDIENLLLVFYTHDVTDNFERFGCSKNYFNSVLKIVNKSNFKISTISDALNLD